ncbi:hypothetical protein [Bacillus bombysepticus]|uniref:hypothetical protein n=1 Tax=Bacillus bombysepticus TaxID=658666 RepID=UPI003015AC5F
MNWSNLDFVLPSDIEPLFDMACLSEFEEYGKKFCGKEWSSWWNFQSKKAKVINEFIQFIGAQYNLEKEEIPEVRFQDLAKDNPGQYQDGVMIINSLKLDEGEEVATTIVHELAHVYQQKVVDKCEVVELRLKDYKTMTEKEKNIARKKANPNDHPVGKWGKELQLDQSDMSPFEYGSLDIEIFALYKEIVAAHYMFRRKTNSQACTYVGYNGIHGVCNVIQTDLGACVVLNKDETKTLYGYKEKEVEGYSFYIDFGKGNNSKTFSEYVDAYEEYIK